MKHDILGMSLPQMNRVFADTYLKYSNRLLEYLFRFTSDYSVAEDLSQEIFMKLWTKREYFNQIEDVRAYLFRMAKNDAIDYLRKLRNASDAIETFQRSNRACFNFTEQVINQREAEAFLQKAIQRLSPQRKRVYMLCKMEGLSYEATAKLLGKSVCTIKEIMRLSNQQVRAFMKASINTQSKTKPKEKLYKHPLVSIRVVEIT